MPENENKQLNIKDKIREEFVKCATDPVYFMRKYYMIQHPQRGRQLFDLYPFQEAVLKLFSGDKNVIINKSRQLGISTLASAYSLWLMLFHKDKNVLVIATKQETAKNMVTKVRFAYDNLPIWLKIGSTEDNRLSLRLTNGSQIKAVSGASDSARSEAVSLLIMDEAAFIDNAEELFGSAQQTLATGGKCIALSTPNGVGNWFHKSYIKAQKKENSFVPVSLPWTVHPERTQIWRDKQDQDLGIRMAAQECFSANTRIFTSVGLKEIKDIKIDDLVLTHIGNFKRVKRLYKKESNDLYKIKTSKNSKCVYVTKDHPFLSNENSNKYDAISKIDEVYTIPKNINLKREIDTIDIYELFNPLHFKKICAGSTFYINDRKHKIKHNCNIELGYELGKIIGLYLAEGSKTRLRVTYAFNYSTELNTWVQDLQKYIELVFGVSSFNIRRQDNTGQISICSEIISQVISMFVEGDSSINKKLSNFYYNNNNIELSKGVLEGYLLGGGCLKLDYNKQYITTSEDLYYDIYYLSNLLGANNISIKYPKNLDPYISEILGRMCICHPKFNGSFLKTKNEELSSIYLGGDRKAKLIKEDLEGEYECYVYNIEVEEDHTYVTEHGIVHNCDCDFSSSGATVIIPEILSWYEENIVLEPLERRGLDKSLWIWEYPAPTKTYLLSADVARGDGADYSAFHVIDVDTLTQVAEFQSQCDTREYANIILATAAEYNNALVAVENANIGWDVLQSILERGYTNLHYSHKADFSLDQDKQMNRFDNTSTLVPGFTMTTKSRPIIIERMRDFIETKQVNIRSVRLLEELRVFIWKNSKPQALSGYNDDLVMSFAIGMYMRDSSIRFRKTAESLTYASLDSMTKSGNSNLIYNSINNSNTNPWKMDIPHMGGTHSEDISWLI